MSVRKFLLAIGVLFVLAGLGLSVVWINRMSSRTTDTARNDPKRPAMLVALHPLPTGTLLRADDFGWKEIPAGPPKPGVLARGQVSDTEYLGAMARRNFAEGEPLIAADLLKPSDRRFLSATLRPGHRAMSISVDAPQSSSGLLLPGDHVDVILTQTFSEGTTSIERRSVGETILHNRRVLAVDQVMEKRAKSVIEGAAPVKAESRPPKTITLEVTETEAQTLSVATQIGKLQLSVRALEGTGAASPDESQRARATWAADVSPAIREVSQVVSGSSVESAVRRPPPSSPVN